MGTVNCRVCGAACADDDRRCEVCGSPLTSVGPEGGGAATVGAGRDEGGTVAGGAGAGTPDATIGIDGDAQATLHSDGPAAQAPFAGPLEVGAPFGPRYRIDALLGAGGMGAVYKAWDEVLSIPVAIKVIRPEVAADPETSRQLDVRFKRELLLARKVTHKNVIRIHDIGEIAGVKYITMSWVDGEDLAAILRREGALPVPRAMAIMRRVVSGMRAAHEAGVVHRDLKPANILVERDTDEPYIMDFGIARSAGAVEQEARARQEGVGGPARERSGETRGLIGTVQYMAPEQFAGEAVDQRADVYSLGLVFYDMLLGPRRIGSVGSAFDEFKVRADAAPAPRAENPDIPEALDRLITGCLAPNADDRPASTAELERELDALDDDGHPRPVRRLLTGRGMAAAAVLVAGLLAGTWWLASRGGAPVEREPVSVLVADLDNRTGDATFDGAVEQALTIAVEGARFISAYSRPAAHRLVERLQPGSALDETLARLVSRREGVGVVLVPAIEKDGSGFDVTVKAVDAAAEEGTDPVLARARSAAGSRDEVLAAVAAAASRIRSALGDATPEGARAAAAETFTAASLDAMRAYARGQELSSQGRFDDALAAYREAVEADPGFGRAWAGMGVVYGNTRQEAKAEESYQKALQNLDRMSERERYRTLGGYYLLVSHDYEKAVQTFESLVEGYPADAAGYSNLALAHLNLRHFDKALDAGRKAVALGPRSVIKRMNYAMFAMYAGDFDLAVAESRNVLEQSPSFGYALFTLARSALAAGDLDAARQAYATLGASEDVGSSLAALGEADLDMLVGRYRDAAALLRPEVAAATEAADRYGAAVKTVALAEAEMALGDRAAAAAAARRATELTEQESVLYPAARVLIAVGDVAGAEALATQLDGMLQSHTGAIADLVRGELALRDDRVPDALATLRRAWQEYDFWFAHFLLGRAYFEAGHLPEALDELQACVDRKGEVTDVFITDGATLRYFPPALFWLARTQEELGSTEAAARSYAAFLDLRGAAEPPDPLVARARQRAAAL